MLKNECVIQITLMINENARHPVTYGMINEYLKYFYFGIMHIFLCFTVLESLFYHGHEGVYIMHFRPKLEKQLIKRHEGKVMIIAEMNELLNSLSFQA